MSLDGSDAYSSTDVLSDGSNPLVASSYIFISPLELRNREIKRQALLELIELVNMGNRPLSDELYPKFFHMVHFIIYLFVSLFIYLSIYHHPHPHPHSS